MQEGIIYDHDFKIFLNLTNFNNIEGRIQSSTPVEIDNKQDTVVGIGKTPLAALLAAFN